jgi:hypothetical protein
MKDLRRCVAKLERAAGAGPAAAQADENRVIFLLPDNGRAPDLLAGARYHRSGNMIIYDPKYPLSDEDVERW